MTDRLNKITDAINDPQNTFQSVSDENPGIGEERKYSSIRGMFVPKQLGSDDFDDKRKLLFQFNPDEIRTEKDAAWNVRSNPGMDFNDYLWSNGGEKLLTFKLWFDATAGSHSSFFRRSELDDASLATQINNIRPRGVLDDTELLESFLHPAIPDKVNKNIFPVPKFSIGGVVAEKQFYPPTVLIFVYGNGFYYEGILKSADITYTVFRKDLIPSRAEVNCVFAAFEHTEVKIAQKLLPVTPELPAKVTIPAGPKLNPRFIGPPE